MPVRTTEAPVTYDRRARSGRYSARYLRFMALALLLVFAAAVSWLVWNVQVKTAARDRAAESATHTLQVLLTTQQLLSAYQDSETGQRGYLLTHDRNFLAPYWHGRQSTPALVAALTRLTARDTGQAANIAALTRLNAVRLAELDFTMRLVMLGRPDDATSLVKDGETKLTMDRIRGVIASIIDTENHLLALRSHLSAEATHDWKRYVGLLSGLGAVALFATTVAVGALFRDYNHQLSAAAYLLASSRVREHRDLLQAVIDSSTDPIFVKDLRGCFVFANRRVAEVYSVAAADMIGKDDTSFVEPATAEALMAVDQRIIATGQACTVEEVIPERDGIHTFSSLKLPWLIDGKVMGLIGISTDITERRQMERQLRSANVELEQRVRLRTAELDGALVTLNGEMKKRTTAEEQVRQTQLELIHVSRRSAMGTMGTTIAHELNQPLTAIVNYVRGSRRLLESGASAAEICDALEAADHAATRAGETLRGVREMIVGGEVHRRSEVLETIIRDVCALALIGSTSTVVSRRLRLDSTIGNVFVDRVQIQQVVLNLLRNSVEALSTQRHRRIVVSTSRRNERFCQVTVRDNGPGIPPEIASRLFEPFNTSKKNGTGIGLSICRTIIEAHGGKMWSNPTKSGTLFRFTVPYA